MNTCSVFICTIIMSNKCTNQANKQTKQISEDLLQRNFQSVLHGFVSALSMSLG